MRKRRQQDLGLLMVRYNGKSIWNYKVASYAEQTIFRTLCYPCMFFIRIHSPTATFLLHPASDVECGDRRGTSKIKHVWIHRNPDSNLLHSLLHRFLIGGLFISSWPCIFN